MANHPYNKGKYGLIPGKRRYPPRPTSRAASAATGFHSKTRRLLITKNSPIPATMGTMTRAIQESQREKRKAPSLSKIPLKNCVRTVKRGKLNSNLFCFASSALASLSLNEFTKHSPHKSTTPAYMFSKETQQTQVKEKNSRRRCCL